MKERPILFSAPMVRAILEGRKTQTRRIVKNAHIVTCDDRVGVTDARCPYGVPGDRLWVREAFCPGRVTPIYRADAAESKPSRNTDEWNAPAEDHWRPSIHMPRWASRITLEVVNVRVERLQAIGHADCAREGWPGTEENRAWATALNDGDDAAIEWFAEQWDSIYGPGAWERNDWVWVYEFKQVRP